MGIIIPGFLGLYAFNLVSSTFFGDIVSISISNDIILGAIYFFALIFSGVIIHEFGEIIQKYIFIKLWNGFPSERFLLDDDTMYSIDVKNILKMAVKERYLLEFPKYTSKESHQIFNLFYTKLQSIGRDEKAQILNAQYGMVRSFIAGMMILTIIYGIISISITYSHGFLFAKYDIFLTCLSILILIILGRRLERFGKRFADYIIRGYYTYYMETKSTEQSNLNTQDRELSPLQYTASNKKG